MKTKKKITAYSFECAKCGVVSPELTRINEEDEYYYCENCNSIINVTRHEMEVEKKNEKTKLYRA